MPDCRHQSNNLLVCIEALLEFLPNIRLRLRVNGMLA